MSIAAAERSPKEIDLAYLAGFFDGEGCICIRSRGKKSAGYSMSCAVSQTDPSILEKFRLIFGGSIAPHEWKGSSANWRPCWIWSVVAIQAADFLDIVSPYLVLKKAEAKVAVEFQRSQSESFRKRHRVGNGALPPTDGEKAVQEAQVLLLRSLKHKVHSRSSDGNSRENT